jgi:hypothetical protein
MAFELTRKLRITGIALAALLALYTAFGFLLAPKLIRSQIEKFSEQHYGRQPSMGEVSFNPFTFALEIHDFDFKDSKAEPLFAFKRLLVNLDLASIWRRGLSLHVIELEHPLGVVKVRADGSLNLAELTAPFAKKPEPAAEQEEPARLFIDRFQLINGAFEFEDHARSAPFRARLTPVNFELLDFGTTGESGNAYSLQATSTAGERFRWSGHLGIAPLSSHGDFELGDVQARTLWSYLQESLGFEVASGVVDVEGSYQFAATEPQYTMTLKLAGVNVGDLGIRPRDGAEDWVHLASLAINDADVDIARGQLTLGSVVVADSKVLARRDARGTLNLLELTKPPAPAGVAPQEQPAPDAPPEAEATDDAPKWTINAPDIRVETLAVDITDEYVKPAAQFTLSPVNLALRGFSTAPGQPLELSADLALNTGGRAEFQGSRAAEGETLAGKLKLEGLNLAALQPYVGTYSQMTLLSGSLDADLDAQFEADAWRLDGNLRSAKLHTVDNALREDLVKWERLEINGIQYRSKPESLRIATIAARAPYVRLIIAPDQTTNISKVLTMPATAPGPVQTVSEVSDRPTGVQQAMAMSIGNVRIHDGSANFADFWITPNYAVSLQQLGGNISGLSSKKDSRAKIELTGKIDRYAPVEIGGELNLLSASLFTDVRVRFDGVELTSVTPYSGRFAGYRIEKGKLSVDVRYQVENRQLDAEQRFIVDQLTLGERIESPDAVKLPLRLAVALLKDRNGVIDLGLPVSGSLDDPEFRLGPIIWKAFVGLLTNVATSPFKLLGGMFGGGEDVNLIDFGPGSAALDEAATEKIASLRRALHERPSLALEVPAGWSPDADYDALAAAQVEQKLAALADKAGKNGRKDTDAMSPLEDPARRFELLVSLYKSEKPAAALPPGALAVDAVRARDRDPAALAQASDELAAAMRPTIDGLTPALEALAQQRARAIQDALLGSGEVEPGRVFMLAPAPKPAVDGKTRVALSLR